MTNDHLGKSCLHLSMEGSGTDIAKWGVWTIVVGRSDSASGLAAVVIHAKYILIIFIAFATN